MLTERSRGPTFFVVKTIIRTAIPENNRKILQNSPNPTLPLTERKSYHNNILFNLGKRRINLINLNTVKIINIDMLR